MREQVTSARDCGFTNLDGSVRIALLLNRTAATRPYRTRTPAPSTRSLLAAISDAR